jgi:hypothetical protein
MTGLCQIPGCRLRGRHLPGCEDDDCTGCLPRLAEDGRSCRRCVSVAAENLALVGEVALAASDAANRLSAGSGGGASGKPGSRLPIDLGAAARLGAVENSLYGWARHVAEERGVREPGLPVPPKPQVGPVCRTRYECTHDSCKAIRDPASPPLLLAVVAGWLTGHLDWLAHRQEAGEAFADFGASARALRGVMRGGGEQKYLGPCGAIVPQAEMPTERVSTHWTEHLCDGDVYGRVGAKTGACRTCGAQVDQAERQIWLADVRRDWLYHASEIAEAYPDIKVDTIRSWLHRGQLTAHGEHEGRPLLKLGDVLDLAAAAAARRAERESERARRAESRDAA